MLNSTHGSCQHSSSPAVYRGGGGGEGGGESSDNLLHRNHTNSIFFHIKQTVRFLSHRPFDFLTINRATAYREQGPWSVAPGGECSLSKKRYLKRAGLALATQRREDGFLWPI